VTPSQTHFLCTALLQPPPGAEDKEVRAQQKLEVVPGILVVGVLMVPVSVFICPGLGFGGGLSGWPSCLSVGFGGLSDPGDLGGECSRVWLLCSCKRLIVLAMALRITLGNAAPYLSPYFPAHETLTHPK